MIPNIFSSLSSKIVFLVSLVLVITATTIMYFTQRDVGKAMLEAEESSAQNVLELVELNIRGEYNGLISDKIDILNRMKADLKNVGRISVSVIDEFIALANQQGVDNASAKIRALSWLSKIRYEKINVFVFDDEGKVISFSDSKNTFDDFGSVHDLKGRHLVKVMHSETLQEEGDAAVFQWQATGESETTKKMAYFIPVREWSWTLGVTVDFDNIEAESAKVLDSIVKVLKATFRKIKIASTGYAFLFTGNGEILITPPGLEASEFGGVINANTGNLLIDDLKRAHAERKGLVRYPDPYGDSNEILEAYVNYFKAFDWYFAAVVPVVEIQAPGKDLLRRQMLVIGLIFLISTVFTFVFVSKISKPLKVLGDYAKELTKLDFTRESKTSDKIAKLPLKYRDEVGRLAQSFVFMEKELKKNISAAIESTAAKERLEREAAEEASRAKGEFLANMSHEIRTPINGMLGMMELLMQTQMSDRQQDFVVTLRDSGNGLLNIINDILDYSKIEASKMELEETQFCPGEVFESTVIMFAEMAQNKGLELVCSPGLKLFQNYIGDSSRIQQVLTNLCGNAVKFTEHGHIEISADVFKKSRDRAFVKFKIKDTGIGIDKDVQRQIFDSFAQADNSTTRRYGGTGLGLSICKKLANLMGGEIGVTSSVGEGSTFWFTVSLKFGESTLPEEEHASDEAAISPRNALIVTDSMALGSSLSKRITEEQKLTPTVITFDEVPKYTQHYQNPSRSFDVILCDTDSLVEWSVYEGFLAELRKFAGSESARCGLLVTLRQKISEGIAGLDKVDFAIAKPVPRVAIKRMLSSHDQFWLDSNSEWGDQDDTKNVDIGANILVAEDNPVNQKLIIEVLKIFGCKIDLAENGKEAVLLAEKNQYDLILMDCQMPEMDGYQATKTIRSREKELGQEKGIAIIALTANVRKEDRDNSLSFGMNDYLSKPFTMAQLREMILKWYCPEEGRSSNCQDSSTPVVTEVNSSESTAKESLLDVDTLNNIRALQSPQSPNILGQLFEIYLNNAPGLVEELDSAIQNQNCESIRNAAHSLKSASGNIGAHKIFELCATLEEMGRDNKVEGARKILDEIGELFPMICELLEHEIQRSAA